jgi:hypothetical protein
MLRTTFRFRAPVYCQICDNSRVEMHKTLSRQGLGFNIKIELGFAVTEMDVKTFQRLIDEHMKKVSPNFHTVLAGHIYNQRYQKVDTVHAGRRYYIGGMMKNGYIKTDSKYNMKRLTGMQGNYKGGLQWGGEKW